MNDGASAEKNPSRAGAYGPFSTPSPRSSDFGVRVALPTVPDHDLPFEREYEGIQKFEPISRMHESQVDILHVGRNEKQGYFYYVMELADDAGLDTGCQMPDARCET